METIQLMLDEQVGGRSLAWDLWTSDRDEWGMLYTPHENPDTAISRRRETWERLSEVFFPQ
jgi:hypothetical protein